MLKRNVKHDHVKRANDAGFTLLEVALTLAVVAVLLAAVAPIAIRQVELKAGERIAREVEGLLQAARVYYHDRNAWPGSVADLQPQYVPASFSGRTPYGAPYTFASTPERFTIRVTVPPRLAALIAAALPFGTAEAADVVAAATVLPGRTADLKALYDEILAVKGAVINPAGQKAIEAVIEPTTGQTVSGQVEDLRRTGVPLKGLKAAGNPVNMVYAVYDADTDSYMTVAPFPASAVRRYWPWPRWNIAPPYWERPFTSYYTAPYIPFSALDDRGNPRWTVWILNR